VPILTIESVTLRRQAPTDGRERGVVIVSRRILIADDEPNMLLSLEFLLKRSGFEVSTAADGQAALDAIERSPPDLVLLDILMPQKSGLEVCQAIRANPALRDIKIVLLTAMAREVDREKGLALGADAYVTKPFSTRELVELIRELLA
jgi:DNA-binding response OmpR family regulator